MAKRINAKVNENIILDELHNILKIDLPENININPGEFFMVRSWDDNPVLSRPFSVFDFKENKLEFFIKLKGKGTEILRSLKKGDNIFLVGPTGNGYKDCENYLCVGAGMGIAPVNYAAALYDLEIIYAVNSKVSLLNFKENDFNVYTLDGSFGEKGNAMYAVKEYYDPGRHKGILACGPEGFLEVLIEYCREQKINLQVSYEERMGCGTGMCMSCAKEVNGEMIKVCKDGPVVFYRFAEIG